MANIGLWLHLQMSQTKGTVESIYSLADYIYNMYLTNEIHNHNVIVYSLSFSTPFHCDQFNLMNQEYFCCLPLFQKGLPQLQNFWQSTLVIGLNTAAKTKIFSFLIWGDRLKILCPYLQPMLGYATPRI